MQEIYSLTIREQAQGIADLHKGEFPFDMDMAVDNLSEYLSRNKLQSCDDMDLNSYRQGVRSKKDIRDRFNSFTYKIKQCLINSDSPQGDASTEASHIENKQNKVSLTNKECIMDTKISNSDSASNSLEESHLADQGFSTRSEEVEKITTKIQEASDGVVRDSPENENAEISEPITNGNSNNEICEDLITKENEMELAKTVNDSDSQVFEEESLAHGEDLGKPNISSSKLMTEIFGGKTEYIPHPLLENFPSMKVEDRMSVDMNMEYNKKMLAPALVFGQYMLSNVYQYQKAKENGYEIMIQVWKGKEEDIPALLEEIEFFNVEKNSTQRGIWGFNKLDKFRKNEEITNVKRRKKGAKTEKFDATKAAARYYKTSDGYISKARKYNTDYPELFDLLLNGVFEFPDADKIIKFKKKNPVFYSDLVNKVISVKDINKYNKYLKADDRLYTMIKTEKVNFEQADKLLEIQNCDFNVYNDFLCEDIAMGELNDTFISLKEKVIMSDEVTAEETSDSEEKEATPANVRYMAAQANNNEHLTVNVSPASSELVISKKVRIRIIDFAAEQHKSVDEFLSELLDNYKNTDSTQSHSKGV